MDFIDVLNRLLADKGISRNKFCQDLNIGKNSVANWEGRGNSPDGEVLTRIAEYFEVTTDYLLGRTHHPRVELIPADPTKEKERPDESIWQRNENLQKLARLMAKLPPSGEQSDGSLAVQLAHRIVSLPPKDLERALDYVALLESQGKSQEQ